MTPKGEKIREEKKLIGECRFDLRNLLNHLMAYSVSAKLIHQSLKFLKTADFSQVGEADGRYNARDMNEQTIGRFNISLLLITKSSEAQLLQQMNEKYGPTLYDEVKSQ